MSKHMNIVNVNYNPITGAQIDVANVYLPNTGETKYKPYKQRTKTTKISNNQSKKTVSIHYNDNNKRTNKPRHPETYDNNANIFDIKNALNGCVLLGYEIVPLKQIMQLLNQHARKNAHELTYLSRRYLKKHLDLQRAYLRDKKEIKQTLTITQQSKSEQQFAAKFHKVGEMNQIINFYELTFDLPTK